MGKIIAVTNHKGGVGKTTSTVNIAAGLNILGKKILVIDLDPQANLSVHFGMAEQNEINIYRALRGEYDLPILKLKDGLDIVVSTIDLAAVETELAGEAGREFLLKLLIEPVRDNYDYILIDCPPSLGLLTLNALSVCETMIVPMDASYFSVVGMTKLFEIVKKVKTRLNNGLSGYKILITKLDSRKTIHKDMKDVILEEYKGNTFNTIIKTNVSLEEAQVNQQSIFDYSDKSTGAEDYLSVCKEILE
jgi:chromosome partitioning protein